MRTEYQPEKDAMPKMQEEEFTPSEYLKAKRYADARQGFKNMNLNEYQITYIAYAYLNKKPFDPQAVQTLLEVGLEQHPASAIVYSRLGDFYKAVGDKGNAIKNYKKSLELEPNNKDVRESLKQL